MSVLVLGDKESIKETEISESFKNSGASHILAVSGLHVGIVILMLTCFFDFVAWCLRRPRWMKWVKFVFVLCGLWSYAYITGLSASIVRTSLMFTIYFVLKTFVGRFIVPHNVVAITALGMLVYNPYYLFNISFQFSFVAVASIMMFIPFLNYREWKTTMLNLVAKRSDFVRTYVSNKHKQEKEFMNKVKSEKLSFCVVVKMMLRGITRYFLDIEKVSLAAQILLFPLLIYYFQTFALTALVSSLVVVPLATFLIPATFLFFASNALFSDCWLTDTLAYVVSKLSRWMIDSVSIIADWKWLRVTDIPFNEVDLFIVWGILLLFYFFIKTKSMRLFYGVVASIFLYTCFVVYDISVQRRKSFIAVYNLPGTTAIHCVEQGNSSIITNDIDKVTRRIGQYWIRERINKPIVVAESVSSFYVGDSLVYVLSEPLPDKCDSLNRLIVNTLVLQKNAEQDYDRLRSFFDYKHLVIDATNSNKVSGLWKDLRDSLDLDCNIVRFDGSYKYDYTKK